MNTPPPCTGGQIGYGDTNRTARRAGSLRKGTNASRKCPPRGRSKASWSVMVASRRARERETSARGRATNARRMAEKLVRSGESPASQLRVAAPQVEIKCDPSHPQLWMFFQVNTRKFFFTTVWM